MHTSDPDCRTDATPLAADERALARHHGYALFSQLFLRGMTADLLPFVCDVPELGEFACEPIDLDRFAADFQHLFGFNLFPYESIFLEPSGLLGGEVTAAVARIYRETRFATDGYATEDHLGYELGWLASYCRLEAASLVESEVVKVSELRQQQYRFLEAHLLRWLCPLAVAISRHENRFFGASAELAIGLIADHYAELGRPQGLDESPFQLPGTPQLMQDDRTRLRDIARYLVTPAYSGIFLSRDDIGEVARDLRLPRGFGNRQQMMLNLMRSAAEYDLSDALLATLLDVALEWQRQYRVFESSYPDIAAFAFPWKRRTRSTAGLLIQIREQIAHLPPE